MQDKIINTPFNEIYPHVGRDGKTLYFASDGHPGLGGTIFSEQKDGSLPGSSPKTSAPPSTPPTMTSPFSG